MMCTNANWPCIVTLGTQVGSLGFNGDVVHTGGWYWAWCHSVQSQRVRGFTTMSDINLRYIYSVTYLLLSMLYQTQQLTQQRSVYRSSYCSMMACCCVVQHDGKPTLMWPTWKWNSHFFGCHRRLQHHHMNTASRGVAKLVEGHPWCYAIPQSNVVYKL